MKQCPKCRAEYFDNMLEFCLEDGTRLVQPAAGPATAQPPFTKAGPVPAHEPLVAQRSEETVVIPAARPTAAAGGVNAASAAEPLPVAIALAHNWWQWIYLEKTYVYSLTDYLLSANFLMWLLLLAGGAAAGIYSVRRSGNKIFGIIGLVTLAINLILFLVPRR